jgi:hypothetical protein
MGSRKNIVIADDEQECREEFTSRPDLFKVIEVANANNLVDELKKAFAVGNKPDLVLLDIWRPSDRVPPDQAEREQRAKESLHDLTVQLEKTRAVVQEAWIPRGFRILEELRSEWPNPDELPIAMYSKRGYFLATPSQLELVENLKAHWILKNDENEYFEYVQDRIERLVNIYRHNHQVKKKLKRMRLISLAGVFISFSLMTVVIGSHFLGSGSLPEAALSCVLSVLLTYGLDRLLLR